MIQNTGEILTGAGKNREVMLILSSKKKGKINQFCQGFEMEEFFQFQLEKLILLRKYLQQKNEDDKTTKLGFKNQRKNEKSWNYEKMFICQS